ncbi:hypothetical protein P692DRAFT_20227824 [Suillus brevipes Sb2]|nr:hypothetical protein P692DRAFT_20227824 [Suillus brevipes Sb2]
MLLSRINSIEQSKHSIHGTLPLFQCLYATIFSRLFEPNSFPKQIVLCLHTSVTDHPLCLEATMIWISVMLCNQSTD